MIDQTIIANEILALGLVARNFAGVHLPQP
jgi:hypothetical protein